MSAELDAPEPEPDPKKIRAPRRRPSSIRSALFLTPDQVCDLFCHPGNRDWLRRHSTEGGFLHPAVCYFGREVAWKTKKGTRKARGRQIYYLRAEIARICGVEESSLPTGEP